MRRSLSNSSDENQDTDKPKKINNAGDLLQLAQDMLAPLIAAAAGAERVGRRRLALPAKEASVVEVLPAKQAPTFRHPMSERDLEDRIIDLYAKGLTTTDIVNHLKEIDGIEMSGSSISGITDKVLPLVKEWQARPLSSQYPILYLDGLHFKVRDSGKIVSKCAFIALGIKGLLPNA